MVDDGFKDLKKRVLQLEIENLENKKSNASIEAKILRLDVIKKKAEIKESKAWARFFKSAADAMKENKMIFQLLPQDLSNNQVFKVQKFLYFSKLRLDFNFAVFWHS